MDYSKLSLSEVTTALLDTAKSAQSAFGSLAQNQLNWKPDPTRWSVGQCFEHLLTANELTLRSTQRAVTHSPESIWQRLPLLPGLLGPVLVRSQAPGSTRKYKAPASARPTTSSIAVDIVQRFAVQQVKVADWTRTLDEAVASRTIMTSPFASFVPYSVLDGLRLMVAHDHRHMEQARRVMQSPDFGN